MNAWRRCLQCCNSGGCWTVTKLLRVLYKVSSTWHRRFRQLLQGPLLLVGSPATFGKSIAVGGPDFGIYTCLLLTCSFLFFTDKHTLDSVSWSPLQLDMTTWLILQKWNVSRNDVSLLNPAHKCSHVPSSPPSCASWILVPRVPRRWKWWSLCSLGPWMTIRSRDATHPVSCPLHFMWARKHLMCETTRL